MQALQYHILTHNVHQLTVLHLVRSVEDSNYFFSDKFLSLENGCDLPHEFCLIHREFYMSGNKIIKQMGIFLTIPGSASDLVCFSNIHDVLSLVLSFV